MAAMLAYSIGTHAELTTSQQIQQIYIGYLGRAADGPGINYWSEQVDQGAITVDQIRINIVNEQTEYLENYGQLTNAQLAVKVYENLLNRAPDQDGLDYWVGRLDQGLVAPEDLILAYINGVASPEDSAILANKLTAAECFTNNPDIYSVDVIEEIISALDSTVSYAQCPPVADAGPDQNINSDSQVQLVGSGVDVEGEVTFLWQQLSGPTVALSSSTDGNPFFTANNEGLLIFQLTVTDVEGAESKDTVSVFVSSNSGGGGQSTGYRVSRVLYDYDNNGLTDAVNIPSYDSQGRPEAAIYTYSGDGATDIFNTNDKDSASEVFELLYDDQNNLVQFNVDRINFDNTTEAFDNTFSWQGSLLSRLDSVIAFGGIVNEVYYTFHYSNAQLDRVDNFFTSNDSQIFSLGFTYGAGNLLSNSAFSSAGLNFTTAFVWRSDQQFGELTTSDANGTALLQATYDEQGRPTQLVSSISGGMDFFTNFPTRNYTRINQYDAQGRLTVIQYDIDSDGSIDAVTTNEWEEGACQEYFIWAPNAIPNFSKNDSLAFEPGTGFISSELCSE